jgi:hypothetical protein
MGRSMLAIVAGFIATIVLSVALLVRVSRRRRSAPTATLGTGMVLASRHTLVCAAFSGYLAAWIAAPRRLVHALALGTGRARHLGIIVLRRPPRTLALFLSAVLVIPATALGGLRAAKRPLHRIVVAGNDGARLFQPGLRRSEEELAVLSTPQAGTRPGAAPVCVLTERARPDARHPLARASVAQRFGKLNLNDGLS